jgi:hypothetical protein
MGAHGRIQLMTMEIYDQLKTSSLELREAAEK